MQKNTQPAVWILAGIGAFAVLWLLFILAVQTTGILFMIPLMLASMLLPLVFSVIAFIDLMRIVREENQGRWETVDILWAIGFFVFPIVAPLVWLLIGRSTRLNEIERARSR